MTILNLTSKELEQGINQGVSIVYFWGPKCPRCITTAPIIEQLDQKFVNKLKIIKIHAQQNLKACLKHMVISLPTVILFNDNKPVFRVSGYFTEEMLLETVSSLASPARERQISSSI